MASIEANSIEIMAKYSRCFGSRISSVMVLRPPSRDSPITEPNMTQSIASSGPAESSLPQGAGKWPI